MHRKKSVPSSLMSENENSDCAEFEKWSAVLTRNLRHFRRTSSVSTLL